MPEWLGQRKLVLYSDQISVGHEALDQRLLALIGKRSPTIAYVAAGRDPRSYWFDRQATYYATLGASMTVGVAMASSPAEGEWERLSACDAIHLSGGNTFFFLRALNARGWLPKLRDYVARGGVLIGVSAGSIMMTPDISSARLCGDRAVRGLDDLSALGLVDFSFAPHFAPGRGWHRKLNEHALRSGRTVHGCGDGHGIVVDGDSVELVGDIVTIAACGTLVDDSGGPR